MRKVLHHRGTTEVNSPKVAIREAGLEGLIEDPELWFESVHKGNLPPHTYHKAIAKSVFNFLPSFEEKLQQLINTLQTLS